MPGAGGAAIGTQGAPGERRAFGGREAFRGTRSVPGNEGVGEHVRARFQPGFGPGEIAEQRFRTERRKLVSSAGPVWKSELSRKSIQPFDLMSRRHPLSSTRAFVKNLLREADRPDGSCDVPASNRRQYFQASLLLLLGNLLRSLLHCALRLLCLLSFLGHVALLM